jgi:hypothetical protein
MKQITATMTETERLAIELERLNSFLSSLRLEV